MRSHEHELFMKLDVRTLMFMFMCVHVCVSMCVLVKKGIVNPIYYFFERKMLFLHPKCNRILVTRTNILFTLTLTLRPMSVARILFPGKPNMTTHKNENRIVCRVRSILSWILCKSHVTFVPFSQQKCVRHSFDVFSQWDRLSLLLLLVLLLLIWWHSAHAMPCHVGVPL